MKCCASEDVKYEIVLMFCGINDREYLAQLFSGEFLGERDLLRILLRSDQGVDFVVHAKLGAQNMNQPIVDGDVRLLDSMFAT